MTHRIPHRGHAFEYRSRRWEEQRWLLDAVIHSLGPDFDQARTVYYGGAAGMEGLFEFQQVAARIQRFSDMHREYAAAARRREAKARAFEAQGRAVAARESYYIASMLWCCARWPIFEVNDLMREYDRRVVETYCKFIEFAPRPVERVEIPYGDTSLPGYLHLPRAPAPGERFPCVFCFPGMDNSKENMVLLYGDKLLERGIAVLAVDGPGQAECVARGIRCTADSHAAAGVAICDWLARHPAIDSSRIALRAISFGTYFGLVAAAALGDRLRGAAVSYVVHEPGMRTIFGHAAPTFKVRFMMMAGYEDEDAFDRFMAEWDVKRWGRQLRCPVLIQGGEEDELSPIAYSEELLDVIAAPKQLAIYEGHKHGLRGGGAVAAGEHPDQMYADWLADRLAGRPMKSEKIFVRMDGSADRIAL